MFPGAAQLWAHRRARTWVSSGNIEKYGLPSSGSGRSWERSLFLSPHPSYAGEEHLSRLCQASWTCRMPTLSDLLDFCHGGPAMASTETYDPHLVTGHRAITLKHLGQRRSAQRGETMQIARLRFRGLQSSSELSRIIAPPCVSVAGIVPYIAPISPAMAPSHVVNSRIGIPMSVTVKARKM